MKHQYIFIINFIISFLIINIDKKEVNELKKVVEIKNL